MILLTFEKDKVVTIRGINEFYYNQFQSLTKLMKLNVGSALSELITHYKKPMPPILGTNKMRLQFVNSFVAKSQNLEVIEGKKSLKLTKKMLVDTGDNTKFMFNNINELILDESITNEICIKYIYRIINSHVTVKGNITNLLLYSLLRSNSKVLGNKNLKEITIRKVNTLAYDEFVATCQLHNQSIGEAVNELFSQYLPEAELMFIVTRQLNSNFKDLLVITGIDEVIVLEKELLALKDRKILFHRIKKIIFEESLSKDIFQKFVIGIYNCESIYIPPSIPKLIELSRIKTFP